ncbi:unnamed protein product [Staurois parvus]|uniref:Uncharacterized protein n=1 Tax=Staurois parvus TaxID=386267 RepID=A0ABN9CAD7_9NEOB|nr:unnamed protein product [Staurois parvus]
MITEVTWYKAIHNSLVPCDKLCDWSQLVTWYKVVVNSLVPFDLCDHSQISYVVTNNVRSDILLTTIHRSSGHSGHWIAVLHTLGVHTG